MRSTLPREDGEGGRQVETEGQTGSDTDQQVPALGGNLKATGEATSQ